MASKLVELANEAGGDDNVSVLLIKVSNDLPPAPVTQDEDDTADACRPIGVPPTGGAAKKRRKGSDGSGGMSKEGKA
jgi:hypothetical protein